LRGEDKADSLNNKASAHASSFIVAPLLEPMDAVFFSILVEQEKETKLIQEAVS
jgi:hypothetical protein